MLQSCEKQRKAPQSLPTAEVITPQLEQAKALQTSTSVGPEIEESIEPKIAIEPTVSVVAISNINLDLDKTDEQVLALKDRNLPASNIQLIVTSYDKVWQEYRVSFKADTGATNQRAFSLRFIDLVGDHNLEIVCRGMNGEGEQTVSIFRKDRSPEGYGLYYNLIWQAAIQGTVEIDIFERSTYYQEGKQNGKSFPIVTLTHDPDSENPLDLIKRIHYWRYPENSYVQEVEELIPGQVVQQRQLSDLYRRGVSAFESFLAGSWFLSESEGILGDGAVFLFFEPTVKRFSYFAGDIQESYTWKNTYRRLTSRVEINGENELVNYIFKHFYVQVSAIDTVQILSGESWNGTYKRVSNASTLGISGSMRSRSSTELDLSGFYLNDRGDEIFFDYPSFNLMEKGKKVAGGYALYDAGVTVLELRVLSEAGLVREKRTYSVNYLEERRDDRIFRSLELKPGVVGVYGFSQEDADAIHFEQIETLEETAE